MVVADVNGSGYGSRPGTATNAEETELSSEALTC